MAMLVGVLALASCGRPNLSGRPQRLDQIADFTELYTQRCSGCHGAEGQRGPAPPLNDPLFLAILPDDVFQNVVTHGRAGTLMPARGGKNWDAMAPRQVDLVIGGIRQRWSGPPSLAQGAPPYLVPQGEQSGNAKRGQELFDQICANCHGKNGEGNDSGPLHSPALLALISDQLLRRIVITGRPDLGMPDYRQLGAMGPDHRPLTSQEVSDLVSHVTSWREPVLKVGVPGAAVTPQPSEEERTSAPGNPERARR